MGKPLLTTHQPAPAQLPTVPSPTSLLPGIPDYIPLPNFEQVHAFRANK
jgi:hypothetical protein